MTDETQQEASLQNDQQPQPEMAVLKTSRCPSLSGRSQLTYEFGVQLTPGEGAAGGVGKVGFRLTHNLGNGMFADDWISLDDVLGVLRDPKAQDGIGSFNFRDLYRGRSVNSPSFLFAALKHEEVVVPHATKRRAYQVIDVGAFEERIRALMGNASPASVAKANTKQEAAHKRPILKLPAKKAP